MVGPSATEARLRPWPRLAETVRQDLRQPRTEFARDPLARMVPRPFGEDGSKHYLSIEDSVNRNLVARRVDDPRLELEHATIPSDRRCDVSDKVNGARGFPLHAPDRLTISRSNFMIRYACGRRSVAPIRMELEDNQRRRRVREAEEAVSSPVGVSLRTAIGIRRQPGGNDVIHRVLDTGERLAALAVELVLRVGRHDSGR